MTARNGEKFPRTARVRCRGDFLSLGRTGDRRRTAHFVVVVELSAIPARLGLTVSRKVGDAVTRNLLKRRVREAFRRHPMRRDATGSILMIAKSGVGAVSFEDVERAMTTGFAVVRSRADSK